MPMKELVPRLALPMPPTYPSCCRNSSVEPVLQVCSVVQYWVGLKCGGVQAVASRLNMCEMRALRTLFFSYSLRIML